MAARTQAQNRLLPILFLGGTLIAAVGAGYFVLQVVNRSQQLAAAASKPKETIGVVVAVHDLYMGVPITDQDVMITQLDPVMITQETTFRTLDEVRAQVEAAWKADQLASRLREKAEAFAKEVEAGKSIEDVAKAAGVTADHAPDVKRSGHPKLSAGAIERMFSIPVGKAATALASATDRIVFKVLDSATPPFDADNETVKAILPQIERAFSEDIGNQYLAQLQKEEGVAINQAAVRNATGATEGN